MKKVKVLIVDDHAVLRMGLASLLGAQPDITVVGDAAGGEAAIAKAVKLSPDAIVMDLAMPGMDGAETTRELLKKRPESKVLVLTTFGTSDGIARALEAGAIGAIMKSAPFDEIVAAIRETAEGVRHVSAEIERILADDPPVPQLSQRQSQILESLVRGLTNGDISRQLGISVDMVKEHMIALFAKIGAANRTEAVAIALRKRLVKQ
jgi:DNA-binding NarL/FixJ family response regulator